MERLIEEEPVDKEKALGSMSSVKDSIIRTHDHLKETGGHMENYITMLENIINIAKEVKFSNEYTEILKEHPNLFKLILDDFLEVNTQTRISFLKTKGIEIKEEDTISLQKRQKVITRNKLRNRLNQFDKFKKFLQELINKTQDLGHLVGKIRCLKENLRFAKKTNLRAQQDQEISIDLMEALCDDFNEKEKIDELTGLGSKKYFENMGTRFIEENKNFHVVFIDLNGLKQINDSYGHEAGDSILRDFAKDLANVLGGDKNTAFRLHGDEFTIISENELSDITEKMDKLTEWLERRNYKIMVEGKVIHIEGKFAYGITKKEKGDDIIDLKSKSEKRMYAHKARMKGEENKYNFGNEVEKNEKEIAA